MAANPEIVAQQLEDSKAFYSSAVPNSVEEIHAMEAVCAQFAEFDEQIINTVPQGAKQDEARALLKQACEASVQSVQENWEQTDAEEIEETEET